jgi:uncharacterized delta-60 repeat protein
MGDRVACGRIARHTSPRDSPIALARASRYNAAAPADAARDAGSRFFMHKQPSSHGGRHIQLLEPRYFFAAGDVDTTFGNAGRLDHAVPGDVSFLMDTVFQPDGKILMGGTALFSLLAQQDQFYFRRFHPDGSLDETFGSGGTVMGNFTPADDDSWLDGFALAPDGKIWAIGRSETDSSFDSFVLARFNADGSFDATFGGGDGYVTIDDRGYAIQLQSDGKVVILSDTSVASNAIVLHSGNRISRYLANGSIDTSFGGGDGMVDSPLGEATTAIRMAPGDKVLLGGALAADGATRFAVARLNTNGTPDTGFSGDGIDTSLVASGSRDGVRDFAFLPAGQFLAVGTAGTSNSGGFGIVRYNANGAVDSSYGDGGSALVSFGSSTFADFASENRVLIDGDGNAILVGNTRDGLAITRLTPGGDLDDTFGRVITFGTGSPELASGISTVVRSVGAGLQADGKLVVTGTRQLREPDDPNERHNLSFLVRYLTGDDGVPSPITLDDAQHVMSVAGSGGADFVQAAEIGDVVHVTRGGYGRAFDVADVARLAITTADGNDVIDTTRLQTVPTSVIGGLGIDKISGGEAGDTLEGSGGNDAIDGNGGADLIIGGNGNDILRGFAGDDTLAGGAGDDELRGGDENDVYEGGPGTDVEIDLDIEGITLVNGVLGFYDADNSDDQVSFIPDGNGNITIYVNGNTSTVDADLVTQIAANPTGGDDFVRVHQSLNIPATLYGGLGGQTSEGGNDTLVGGGADDTLIGFDGDDVLFGNGGNDYLNGGSGADDMHGNAGRDTVDYSSYDGRVIVSLDATRDDGFIGENDLAFSDIERVLGGAGDDRIGGGDGTQILVGGPGNDTLSGGGGTDALYGAEGNDKLDGGDGDDYLEAGAGHDLLFGGAGADQLFALAGNDTLLSDDGITDVVRGGTGTDTGDIDGLDDVLTVEVLS